MSDVMQGNDFKEVEAEAITENDFLISSSKEIENDIETTMLYDIFTDAVTDGIVQEENHVPIAQDMLITVIPENTENHHISTDLPIFFDEDVTDNTLTFDTSSQGTVDSIYQDEDFKNSSSDSSKSRPALDMAEETTTACAFRNENSSDSQEAEFKIKVVDELMAEIIEVDMEPDQGGFDSWDTINVIDSEPANSDNISDHKTLVFDLELESIHWMEEIMANDIPGHPLQEWEAKLVNMPVDFPLNRGSLDQKIGLFQGDIAGIRLSNPGNASVRNIELNRTWTKGIVPYIISSSFSYWERGVIKRALNQIESVTCIKFTPRKQQINYIHILPHSGCYSTIGMRGGPQVVSLGTGCVHHGIIQHEVLHALGFLHEQSRGDRDNFVSIIWNNIQSGMKSEFTKHAGHTLNYTYDMRSIMHYGPKAFSRNGRPTIQSKLKGLSLRENNWLSVSDVNKLNQLYRCNRKRITTLPFNSANNIFNSNSLNFVLLLAVCSMIDLRKFALLY